jgi:hypothetical protein
MLEVGRVPELAHLSLGLAMGRVQGAGHGNSPRLSRADAMKAPGGNGQLENHRTAARSCLSEACNPSQTRSAWRRSQPGNSGQPMS